MKGIVFSDREILSILIDINVTIKFWNFLLIWIFQSLHEIPGYAFKWSRFVLKLIIIQSFVVNRKGIYTETFLLSFY